MLLTAKELKEKLTDDDIKNLLLYMDAYIHYEDDNVIISNTICHQGSKPKLYYYKESKTFYCYTECGSMDIIDLVLRYKDFDQNEKYKAVNWICIKLNISDCEHIFGKSESKLSDWEFINRFKRCICKDNSTSEKLLVEYNDSILKIFQQYYTELWNQEGISFDSMKKYNILYSVWQHSIIIPHYSIDNKLIGIRTRNLGDWEIEFFGKYAPLKIGNIFYSHPLGQNLYGLNHNLNAIKRKRKIMLVESEKSVMQTDTMFDDDNFTVALCGSNLTDFQKNIILSLGVREVIIGLDKQYESLDSEECKKWANHIKEKIIDKLSAYVTVSVLWDTSNLLGYKDSPTDKGKEVLLELMNNKIYVPTNE